MGEEDLKVKAGKIGRFDIFLEAKVKFVGVVGGGDTAEFLINYSTRLEGFNGVIHTVKVSPPWWVEAFVKVVKIHVGEDSLGKIALRKEQLNFEEASVRFDSIDSDAQINLKHAFLQVPLVT